MLETLGKLFLGSKTPVGPCPHDSVVVRAKDMPRADDLGAHAQGRSTVWSGYTQITCTCQDCGHSWKRLVKNRVPFSGVLTARVVAGRVDFEDQDPWLDVKSLRLIASVPESGRGIPKR